MNSPHKRWLTVVTLICCLDVFLGHFEGVDAHIAPKFPGEGASMDELAQFYNEVQQFLNSANRLRYGKRSSDHEGCGDPDANLDCYT
uniref:Uncharacterized protein n=1 Tax=Anolis carolinensis TaxID=28377 RepID=A0A803SPT1_ANOCA